MLGEPAWPPAIEFGLAALANDPGHGLGRMRRSGILSKREVLADLHVATCVGILEARSFGRSPTLDACRTVARQIATHVNPFDFDVILLVEACAFARAEEALASRRLADRSGNPLQIVRGYLLVSDALIAGLAECIRRKRRIGVFPEPALDSLVALAVSELRARRLREGLTALRLYAVFGKPSDQLRSWLTAMNNVIAEPGDPIESAKLNLLSRWTAAVLEDPSWLIV